MEFHRAPLPNEVLWTLMLSQCHLLKYESGWKYRRFQEGPRRMRGRVFPMATNLSFNRLARSVSETDCSLWIKVEGLIFGARPAIFLTLDHLF